MRSYKKNSMQFFLNCLLLGCFFNAFSQEESLPIKEISLTKIDSLYREDQFYCTFTYNTLLQNPTDFSQSKFSTGFSGGFLRDMPVNKDRTIAIAAGLGFTYNNYNQNIAITGTSALPVYSIVDSDTNSKNKFSQLLLDVPIEFRWRTSTYENHKFWRIYGGVKFSYLVYDKSVYIDTDSNKTTITANKDFNKLLYGLYISSGYNTINVYAYYGLNSIFDKSIAVNGEKLNSKSLNIGLVFYIL